MNGRGLLPGDPAKRLVRAPVADHHFVRAARASLVGHADLSPCTPKVLDQGQTSTCWAHSAATLLFTRRKFKGGAVQGLQSPLYFAQTVYGSMRAAAHPTGELPPLQDTGTDLDTADACFGRWGSQPFVGDGATDVPEGQLPEAEFPAIMSAQSALFSGPYDITPDGNAPETVGACLEAGIPVWIGVLIGEVFQRMGPNDVAQPCDPGDPSAGGHAMSIIGYDKDRFLVRNSWGGTWNRGGDCYVSAAFLASAWQLLPFEVS